MEVEFPLCSFASLLLCLNKFDDTHSSACDVTDHHHGNICAITNTGVQRHRMPGSRGNWLKMIRLSIIKVHSNTLAVAASVVERNTSITILKSTKQEVCITEGWARLILKCCSHSAHGFLKKSLSMLSCMMTIKILQEQGACLPNYL